MARRRKRDGRLPPFVPLSWELLNSSAYKELKYSSAKALPFFLGKPKCPSTDRAYYTTVFTFSYAEAKRLGFAQGTWSGVIRDLVETGLVDPVEKGGLRGEGHSCSLFRLSNRWKEYGKPSFNRLKWEEFFSLKAV
jgi:hypothetical protein